MADDDDLDDFFAEVSEAEAKATEENADDEATKKEGKQSAEEEETHERPAKKQKTSAPVRPRGVVVAASTSVVIPAKKREEMVAEMESKQELAASASLPVAAGPMRGPAAAAASSIGPAIPVGASNPHSSSNAEKKGPKASVRMAAGQTWVDESLDEWPENDYRIFVGNLSNEVTDQSLFQHFSKYPSLAKAKVVRHNNNPEKSKGYGFISLLDPLECARAIREMDQTWLCSRPIRVKRSDWKERDFKVVRKREKKEKKQQKRMGLRM